VQENPEKASKEQHSHTLKTPPGVHNVAESSSRVRKGPFLPMSCTKPRPAWNATLPNPTGKHSISFNHKRTPADHWIPCGKCDGCTAATRLEWAVRMTHESQCHKQNCFVTLTYNDENCPDKINRADPQLFLKRLSKKLGHRIRYFLTGEYGDKTHRPHYHAILFGVDFLGNSYPINNELYGNKHLDQIWSKGNTSIAEFNMATAMYTAGYTAKKIKDPDTFSVMSRRPPLGRAWLRKNYSTIINLDKCIINGQEFPVPKAYMRWLSGVEEIDELKEEREIPNRLTDQQMDSKEIHYKQYNSKRMNNEKH